MSIFIVYNLWLNSEIVPQWIQQKISRRVTKTDSQKLLLEFENCKQQLFKLPCAYQRACELKLPGPRLITRSQLGRFLQNVMTISFRDWFFSFQYKEKKLSHRKHVQHNPNVKIRYASRCWAKIKWLHVLRDKLFPEVRTTRVESMKT